MKKLITTIAFSILMVTLTNAQIKKPKVKVDVNKVQTQKPSSGLLLKSSVKLKTLQDLNKLNIPVTQITKEKLNAKPTRSWGITPLKIRNGDLKLGRFNGHYDVNMWAWSSNNRGFNIKLRELENGKGEDPHHDILPFTIKFRAIGGVEYRLKINQRTILHTRRSNYLYIKKGNFISKIQMNELEFNYIFKESRSGEIEILFSGVAILDNTNRQGFYPLMTEKIEIDRIN